MRAPDWLTARPVAHRGLHDRARGIIENMPRRVRRRDRGQLRHRDRPAAHRRRRGHGASRRRARPPHRGLGRLLGNDRGRPRSTSPFKDTAERMMTLGDLCDLVAGRVPLVIEVKSHFDGDRRLVGADREVLAGYRGPAAVMSFDPGPVLALREIAPDLPRGIVAERHYDDADWHEADAASSAAACCICATRSRTRPHFVAYLGQRPARARRLDRPQRFRPAAADLDRAHAGAARTRRALRRPDDLRGLSAVT